ncbi:MAG TPA: hypothetical protein VKF17_20535, partial [Isosphaeraceae bacterium]|nr:hypothetical protein [Isosphaeraceae bacterium]
KRLGTDHHKNVLKQKVRIVKVQTDKLDSNGKPNVLVLVTNLLDLPAELVALGYKYRWAVEMSHSHYPSSYGLYRGSWAA